MSRTLSTWHWNKGTTYSGAYSVSTVQDDRIYSSVSSTRRRCLQTKPKVETQEFQVHEIEILRFLCIFDEPEAGIDLWSFSMLIQKFEEIHTEKKQSLIVISHQEKIINMADRIMIIDGGEIKKIGTKDEVLPYLNGVQKCHKCVERLEGRS